MALTSAAERSCILRRWRAASFLGHESDGGGWDDGGSKTQLGNVVTLLCICVFLLMCSDPASSFMSCLLNLY
jgi:hypothetical protein